MAFKHTKKVEIRSSIKAMIRIRSQTSEFISDQKDPDPQHWLPKMKIL
jgi:hypothetical protein